MMVIFYSDKSMVNEMTFCSIQFFEYSIKHVRIRQDYRYLICDTQNNVIS